MSKRAFIRHLPVIAAVQAVIIVFLCGFLLYALQYVHKGSTVTLTPALTSSSQATILPDATSTPSLDMQVPPATNSKIQPAFTRI